MTTQNPERPRWGIAAAFSAFTLAAGMLSAALGFALQGVAGAAAPPALRYPPFYPPPWFFWAVWVGIYPCWGVATYLVWERRRSADVRGALVVYATALLGNVLFVPILGLVGGNPAVLTLMDANGLIGAALMAWLYSRYSRPALLWLAPLLAWLPVTFLLKIALWRASLGL